MIRNAGLGAGLGAFLMGARGSALNATGGVSAAQAATEGAARGGGKLSIRKIRCFLTQPAGIRLAVVKVETSEPGLYGLGCATFTQRIGLVQKAVDDFLDPFLRGRDPANIQDNWQSMFQSSYWRNGPVLMSAISGVDQALWDILGKRAGMPIYQLLGGACRFELPTYSSISANDSREVAPKMEAMIKAGYRHIRIQHSIPGQASYGGGGANSGQKEQGHFTGNYFNPVDYANGVPKLFEGVRKRFGDDIELLHDVHERVPPPLAMRVAKSLEPYRLFYLEDPFAPEDVGYYERLRQQSAIPIAMGELFTNPTEYVDLIANRQIDFIRCHISMIGGLSPAVKLANFCDFFRVRTAWHGPGDCSPVGHAINGHVSMSTWNFGVQEFTRISDPLREAFPGSPEFSRGNMVLSDRPGCGVDMDEKVAAKYPVTTDPPFDLQWGRLRGPDGTIIRP